MLVISRKPGEVIFIGDDIRVSILEVKGKQVRVGVDAPSEIVILRNSPGPAEPQKPSP